MKLFYKPGACSLAPHIVAHEAAIDLEIVQVDLVTKKTEQDEDYLATNPNGYVPALVLDNGELLTESQILVQYLADLKPESGLMPKAGEMDRYRAQRWLAFISSELHKTFGPLFRPDTPEATKQASRALLAKRLSYVDASLEDKSYLFGDRFTAADAYLWTVLRWSGRVGVDLTPYENIGRFMEAVAARPAVQATLKAEKLA
jgi:glutathione S-transferase